MLVRLPINSVPAAVVRQCLVCLKKFNVVVFTDVTCSRKCGKEHKENIRQAIIATKNPTAPGPDRGRKAAVPPSALTCPPTVPSPVSMAAPVVTPVKRQLVTASAAEGAIKNGFCVRHPDLPSLINIRGKHMGLCQFCWNMKTSSIK